MENLCRIHSWIKSVVSGPRNEFKPVSNLRAELTRRGIYAAPKTRKPALVQLLAEGGI